MSNWKNMENAPTDGKHVILAVRFGCFIYHVEGAYMHHSVEQGNGWICVGKNDIVEPLAWMPKEMLPKEFLPEGFR